MDRACRASRFLLKSGLIAPSERHLQFALPNPVLTPGQFQLQQFKACFTLDALLVLCILGSFSKQLATLEMQTKKKRLACSDCQKLRLRFQVAGCLLNLATDFGVVSLRRRSVHQVSLQEQNASASVKQA